MGVALATFFHYIEQQYAISYFDYSQLLLLCVVCVFTIQAFVCRREGIHVRILLILLCFHRGDDVELNVLGCRLTYWGQTVTMQCLYKHGSVLLYVHSFYKAH